MKQVICTLLAALLVLFSSACGSASISTPAAVVSSSTSNPNSNISSVPTEDPAISVPESIPSVTPDGSSQAVDGYPGEFQVTDEFGEGSLVFPGYYGPEQSIIAYAEILGFSQFTDDSEAMVFYIGGDSWGSPDVRATVKYSRRMNYISIYFKYTNGDNTSMQISMEEFQFPEWVGNYDDFPDELTGHMANFLRELRATLYYDTIGEYHDPSTIGKAYYRSWSITYFINGVMTEEEQNWPG